MYDSTTNETTRSSSRESMISPETNANGPNESTENGAACASEGPTLLVGDASHDDSLGSAETRAVFWLKLVLLLILVASTVGVALLVYFYTSEAETSEFEDRFDDEASTLLKAVGNSFFLSLGAFDSLIIDMVAYARYSNSSWPFVTMPDYAVRAAKVRSLSRSFAMFNYHLVTAEQRLEWEDYSLKNDPWVNEGLEVQRDDENYHGKLQSQFEPYGIIHGNHGDSSGPGPFLPSWQGYPVVPVWPPYNYDGASYSPIANSFSEIFEARRAVVRVANLPDLNDPSAVEEADLHNYWAKHYIRDGDDPAEPVIEIQYPVSTAASKSVRQSNDGRVVGVLISSIYWRELIQDILPPRSGGITAVFEFGADRTFTYLIDGPEAVYLGRGDLHDTRFDHLERSSKFLADEAFASRDRTYTGLPLSDATRDFTIRIYPSAHMEEHFLTNDPVIFTLVTVLCMAFTSSLFLVYDRCVERRQQKVMHTAVQSTANVALLEEMVQERTRRLEESNAKLEAASASQLQHFAAMSHEIRTPMNGIIGLSSLLEETELNPMQAETMKMIVSSGELLVAIVNDVLDFSRLESGKVDICITRSNLQEALSSTVHSINLRGKSSSVSVHTHYDPLIPEYIDTDARRLRQILYNLLGNAVKFSREGGSVELHVSVCTPAQDGELGQATGVYSPPRMTDSVAGIAVDSQSGKVLRFVVKDYGRGIKWDDLPQIFQPFSQAGQETASVYGGTGLGLAITAKLVHGLGGSIYVESQEGKWSNFSVDLPLTNETVNVEGISSQLREACVFLVGGDQETNQRMSSVFSQFQVRLDHFGNLKELETDVVGIDNAAELNEHQYCICIVNESVFDRDVYEAISRRRKSALLTFGPKFLVKDSRNHYRSLLEVLPSLLLTKLVGFVEAQMKLTPINMHPEETPGSPDKPVVSFSDMRFLIAEDNLVNQKVLKRILVRLGADKVDIVNDGKEAVEAESRTQYDIIWMDMQMPRMDGVDACKLINARQGGHPKPKIVFVTAHVLDRFEEECFEAGAVGFLAKPCNIRGVKECFEKVTRDTG